MTTPKPPDTIYLTWDDDGPWNSEVYWSDQRLTDTDIEYSRVPALQASVPVEVRHTIEQALEAYRCDAWLRASVEVATQIDNQIMWSALWLDSQRQEQEDSENE